MSPFGRRALRVLAAAAMVVLPAAALYLIFLKLPDWQRQLAGIKDTKDRILAENEVFRTLIQLAGGSIVIFGFYFTAKTIRVTQEGQITDRFNKAIDHLGEASLSMRLGGIYALARIAADSEKDAPTILEIFTAYLRETTPASELETPATDVKAILSLLGNAAWAREPAKDLSGCKLRGLELKNADLRHTVFVDADLRGTNLEGSRLDGVTFVGAKLEKAYLRRCSLRAVDLTAADLTGATLRDAGLQSAKVFGAVFENTSILGANFTGATGAVRQQFESALYDDTTTLPVFQTDLD